MKIAIFGLHSSYPTIDAGSIPDVLKTRRVHTADDIIRTLDEDGGNVVTIVMSAQQTDGNWRWVLQQLHAQGSTIPCMVYHDPQLAPSPGDISDEVPRVYKHATYVVLNASSARPIADFLKGVCT